MLEVREFQPADRQAVIAIWQRCGLATAWNDPQRDIARKMQIGRELFLIGCVEQKVVASIMGGYDGHRGWINYLAVDPDHQRRGHAADMVHELEVRLVAIGCPKVNLQVRNSNRDVIEFYERIGYSVEPNVSLGKRLIPDQHD